jgi:hypothetical protein
MIYGLFYSIKRFNTAFFTYILLGKDYKGKVPGIYLEKTIKVKCQALYLVQLFRTIRCQIIAIFYFGYYSGITPVEGTEETVRVVAMEKDFHVDCYVCEVQHLILLHFL